MLCSLIVEAGHRIRYDSIMNQNWDDFELIYIIPQSPKTNDAGSNANSSETEYLLQQNFCKAVYGDNDILWSKILEQAQGKYIAWVHTNELWAHGYLDQIRTILDNKNPEDLHTIISGYGFVQPTIQGQSSSAPEDQLAPKLDFITNRIPALFKPNKLFRNLNQPKYYNPFIKYFFSKSIVVDNSIPYDYSLAHWQERYALLCLRYILTLKLLSGGREPDFEYHTIPFSLPWNTVLDTNTFDEYQSVIEDNRKFLSGSVFEMNFWVFMLLDIRARLTHLFRNNIK